VNGFIRLLINSCHSELAAKRRVRNLLLLRAAT
jgi:hypothetical protein